MFLLEGLQLRGSAGDGAARGVAALQGQVQGKRGASLS